MQATTENPPCVPHLRACGHASTRTNDNHSSTIITFMIHGWLFSTRPLEVIGTKIDLEKKNTALITVSICIDVFYEFTEKQ